MSPTLSDLERLINECDMDSFMESYYQHQQKQQAITNMNSYNSTLLAGGAIEPSVVKHWLDEQQQLISFNRHEVKKFRVNEERLMKMSLNTGYLGV